MLSTSLKVWRRIGIAGSPLTPSTSSNAINSKKAEIVLGLRFFADGEIYHLVFTAIPNRIGLHAEVSFCADTEGRMPFGTHSDWPENSVLIGVTHTVKCVEDLIPSTVRLERSKKRVDLIGDIFGVTSNAVFEICLGPGEREVGTLGVDVAASDGQFEAGVVQGLPEIINEVPHNIPKPGRECFSKPYLVVEKLGFISVLLDNIFVGLAVDKNADLPFQIEQVLFSPFHFSL